MNRDKENVKYLKLLKQNYSSSQAVIREIINLSAITNLPKGTELTGRSCVLSYIIQERK